MSSTPALIDIQKLTWSYPATKQLVFDHLDFKLEKNDFCFVVGKSGVGKTTLVKFLIRQLKPPKKMVFHQQEDIARFSGGEVQSYRRNIGVIFQDFKLIEWKNVYENIAYPLQMKRTPRAEIKAKVEKVLELLDLSEKKTAKIPYLSGGEKQRVAIGRALINDPEFIIADEPTGNLDQESSRKIADTLIELNKAGNTIVFITHDQSLIKYVEKKHKVKLVKLHNHS